MAGLSEFINLTVDLIPKGRPNRPGTKLSPTKVTIHTTDNDSAGADAKAHSKFVKTTGYYLLKGEKHYVSWHFTVDDRSVYQHLPVNEVGWHAGSGNAKSVAVEICMNKGINQNAANLRAATLVASLLADLKLKSSDVVPHMHWTGKKCPTKLLDGGALGAKWSAFIDLIDKAMAAVDTTTELVVSKKEMKGLAAGAASGPASMAEESLEAVPAAADDDHAEIAARVNARRRKRTASAAGRKKPAAKKSARRKSAKRAKSK